jgi:dynein light intermediate chain 1
VLYVIFSLPNPAPNGVLDGPAAPVQNAYFFYMPDSVDVVVPTGRDSCGMIVVLRDGLDASAWGSAWNRDLVSITGIDLYSEARVRWMYASLLRDPGRATKLCAEQAVLAKDENAGRADRDLRGILCTPIEAPGAWLLTLLGP